MSVVFDPFTGQIIDTGSSSGPAIGGAVAGADPNAILITDGATNLADVQLADGQILIGKTGDAPLATTITGTTNQVNVTNGPNSITLSTPQDIDSTASPTFANLDLTPNGALDTTASGILNIGTTEATTINIGNAGTTVNIYGDTIYQNVTNLNVTDKNITVNNGGSLNTSFNSGIHVYEDGVADAGYLEVTLDMMGWDFKAPHDTGVAVIKPGAVGFTIDQGSHNPITIAAPANGLAIDDPYNQELSIALADASTTGALSSTDWNTFNNKQDEYIFKVTAYDPINTVLPIADPVVIDGHTVLTGDKVLFSNLSSGNNEIYEATVSAGLVTWSSIAAPVIDDYVLVQNGDAFALQAGVFNGTSYDFNKVIRHFNGVDYWEQSAIYNVSLSNDSNNNVFTINSTNSENMIIDYSIYRGTRKTTGTLHITSDGITAQVSDVGVNLNTPVGISFSASIALGQITLVCTTDNSGDNGTLKYNLRRWSDSAGGPGGLPSYSSGGGSGSISVEQVSSIDPTIPFSNINTIQFDNDTGFNVTQTIPGIVKVSLGSTFKTWNIDNGLGPVAGLVAEGEDTVTFVAGSGIEFQADNTSGAKTFTVNATGGSSVTTVTLDNGVSNQNVPGFVVDPTSYDAFNADIVMKRAVSSGIETKYLNTTDSFTKIAKTQNGYYLYNNSNGGSSNQIIKLDENGNIDTVNLFNSIVSGAFNGRITSVIDFFAEGWGSILVVFGNFSTYNGLVRNSVVFLGANDGSDWEQGYKRFGSGTYSGSGFTNGGGIASISSAIKILSTTNYGDPFNPIYYGFLVSGTFDNFNGTSCSKLIFATMYNSSTIDTNPTHYYWGDLSLPLTYGDIILKEASKGSVNFPYFFNQINFPPTSVFYAISGSNEIFKLENQINGANSTYVNPFSSIYNSGMGLISGVETDSSGYIAYVYGNNIRYLGPNPTESIWGLLKHTTVPVAGSGLILDTTFNPFNGSTLISVNSAKTFNDDQIYICGNISTTCNNFSIINSDGTLNTGMLQPFGSGFAGNVYDIQENLFLNSDVMAINTIVSGYTSPTPATYMTTMYGCYDDATGLMKIQGYTNTAGIYSNVTFTIDSAGQLKYTSTNNLGGTSFPMKYNLKKL